MAEGEEKKSGLLNTATALVSLVSIALGAGGSYLWMSKKDLAEHQTNQIKIALALLSERNADNEAGLRAWAVEVIDYYSPVKIPPDGKQALISGDAVLPEILPPAMPIIEQSAPPAAQVQVGPVPTGQAQVGGLAGVQEPEAGSRLERVMALQNAGIRALLDGDLRVAVSSYEAAYRAWPTFRNVQEIRDVLRRRAKCIEGGQKFEGDVKAEALYRLRVYDLRDLDEAQLRRLRDEGRWNDKEPPSSPCVAAAE